MSKLAQHIFVENTHTHASAITAGARASVGAFCHQLLTQGVADPIWDSWLEEGRMTKVTRTANPSRLERILRELVGDGREVFISESAFALVPQDAPLPTLASRARTSGLEFSRQGSDSSPDGNHDLVVTILETLSTGKAVAAGAHGLWSFITEYAADSPETVMDWWTNGAQFELRFGTSDQLNELAHSHSMVIRDVGNTEVAPSTVTAVTSLRS